jgi:hypothetical protein
MLSWLYAYAFVASRLCFCGFTPMLSRLYAYALVASRLCPCGFMPMQRDLTHADRA